MLQHTTERSSIVRTPAPRRRPALSFEAMETRVLLTTAAVISWKMAPQIALDPANGNAPTLPNTPAYVNPAGGYQVLLDASKTPGIQPTSTYTWTVSAAGRTVATVQGEEASVSLPEGPYALQLTVNGVQGADSTAVASENIVVKDVLIVSIGDSYASGEGNPVVNGLYFVKPAQWAYSPNAAMNLQNAKGHRSTLSAPAQFALALENSNPHEAVTFVSVANSGAQIDKGLLGSMTSNVDSSYTLPAQIEEVRQIVGSRPIDVLTVSVGGNDIGFSSRLTDLASASIGGKTTLSSIRAEVKADLAALPQKYAALDQAIQGLKPARVLVTEYPDLTRNQQGQYAPIRFAGVAAISKANVRFADQSIRVPLNRAIETAAAAHGWTAVGSLDESFRTHGYASNKSWFQDVGKSLRYEATTIGAFHPNIKGQQAIANWLLAVYDQSAAAATS